MRRNKTHILNEVSAEFAGKAQKSAIEKIKRLTAEFAESDFKDTEILAKLQKLAQQRNRFTDYINDANNEAADQVAGPLKRVIKKWSSGRTLSNGTVFKPLFTLKSEEVKTREVVKQRWGSDFETYKNDVKDIPFSKLIVIGLNSDFDAQIKAGKKYNMDYSQYEQLHDEYDAINDELKNDLLAINGISYSWSRADRRNKRNPYDTITMVFYIDTKLIDTEIMSQKLGGYSFYDTDYRKTAGSCGGFQDGTHYSGVPYGTFKTRRMELHADEKLNNEKIDNKALYEKIMRNVSREVKKALNEMERTLDRSY